MIDKTGVMLDSIVEYLTDCRDNNVVDKLSDYPWIYDTFLLTPTRPHLLSETLKWLIPVGYPVYLLSKRKRKKLVNSLEVTINLSEEIIKLLRDS